MVVCVLALPLGVGRQALHHPSPAATSALAAASSEEEGLHARPLPHTFGEYICVVTVYIGGGRIGTFSHPPHFVAEFSGGGGTGLPPYKVGDFCVFYGIVDDYTWESLDRSIAPTIRWV